MKKLITDFLIIFSAAVIGQLLIDKCGYGFAILAVVLFWAMAFVLAMCRAAKDN